MYVTKYNSELTSKKCLKEVPDGPNLGFLLIYDEPKVVPGCFGSWKKLIQFSPESHILVYNNMETNLSSNYCSGITNYPVILIPALNQPVLSNQFYLIHAEGKLQGESFSFDCENNISYESQPQNIYEKVKLKREERQCKYETIFMSLNDDILHLTRDPSERWILSYESAYNFYMAEARGINSTLRARLPEVSEQVNVGTWYCPFMFVREGRIRDQVERAMYYEVILNQRWKQVLKCMKGSTLRRNFEVETEQVFIGGTTKAKWNEAREGVIWFEEYGTRRHCDGNESVGLRVEVVERMKYEQERGGWKNGSTKDLKVLVDVGKFLEEPEEEDWKVYCCYVLVERFVFIRRDRTVALIYEFYHTHQIRTIWK